jgi:cysteine protease ATG4
MGDLSVNEVRAACDHWKNQVLVLISTRLGMTNIDPAYHTPILEIMKLKQCVGLVGGQSRSAYFFCGVHGTQLIYLDPHVVRPSSQTEGCAEPRAIPLTELVPDICFGFLLRSEEDLKDLETQI